MSIREWKITSINTSTGHLTASHSEGHTVSMVIPHDHRSPHHSEAFFTKAVSEIKLPKVIQPKKIGWFSRFKHWIKHKFSKKKGNKKP